MEITALDTKSWASHGANIHTERGWGLPPAAHSPASTSPAWSSQEGAYLCSPNLESIEAEWLHFKCNYYKPFRECELQNEISLSKLSLMRSGCVGIGLHRCLRALHGEQILRGAVHGEPAYPLASLEVANPKESICSPCLKKTKTNKKQTPQNPERLSWEHVHLDFSKAGHIDGKGHPNTWGFERVRSELKPAS